MLWLRTNADPLTPYIFQELISRMEEPSPISEDQTRIVLVEEDSAVGCVLGKIVS